MSKIRTTTFLLIIGMIMPIIASANASGSAVEHVVSSSNTKIIETANSLEQINDAHIVFTFDENVSEDMRNVFEKAALLWESKLNLEHTFILYVTMYDIPGVHPLEVEVSTIFEGPNIGCPYSLARQTNLSRESLEIDAGIFLNNSVEWNTNPYSVNFEGYDAYTVALRAIAISMGFGSSLMFIDESNPYGIDYKDGYPSYFDQIILGDGRYLPEYEMQSPEIFRFITSNNAWVIGGKDMYPLHAPRTYAPWETFIYIDVEGSLMWSDFKAGDFIRNIDLHTIDILECLGWDFDANTPDIKIAESENTQDLSAYQPYHLSLEETNYNVCKWELFLKNKSGILESVKQSSDSTFLIDGIDNIDNYYIDKSGCIEGIVECKYKKDGKIKFIQSKKMLFDVKPKILSVDNFKIIEDSPYSFHAEFDVISIGNTTLLVDTEEEFGGIRISHDYDYNPVIHAVTDEASSLYYTWIYITAINKYGKAEKTIEVEPKEFK